MTHNYDNWLGNTQSITTTLNVETANLMQVTLNRAPTLQTGDVLPNAWHWMYFHAPTKAEHLGVEGHPELGRFIPPISFGDERPPRRMWAGGSFQFLKPLRLGVEATKRSTVKSITPKQGRSGALVFVVVEHEVSVDGETCVLEDQTIVYREPLDGPPQAATNTTDPVDAGAFSAKWQPDPIMLFRYSALTFNGHRIHYDVDFCREHEGYPNLVVHGPLIATLILDLYQHEYPDKVMKTYSYRARSPLFIPNAFDVNGSTDGNGWARNHLGQLAMTAEVGY